MKTLPYFVFNQAGTLVARCQTRTAAALLVLALSDGLGNGAKVALSASSKTDKDELFTFNHDLGPATAAEIAEVINANEVLLPAYRTHTSRCLLNQAMTVAAT